MSRLLAARGVAADRGSGRFAFGRGGRREGSRPAGRRCGRFTTPSISTASPPGPAIRRPSTPPPACRPRRRGRSASAWSPRSRAGRGTRSSSKPRRECRPTGLAGSTSSAGRSTGRPARSGCSRSCGRGPRRSAWAAGSASPGTRRPGLGDPALDVVVHASTRPEPFGRVIVEGMACGRAVVAVRDGGSAELFEDGVEALGVPPDDPDALAAAIDRLVADADLRRSPGRRRPPRRRGPLRPSRPGWPVDGPL